MTIMIEIRIHQFNYYCDVLQGLTFKIIFATIYIKDRFTSCSFYPLFRTCAQHTISCSNLITWLQDSKVQMYLYEDKFPVSGGIWTHRHLFDRCKLTNPLLHQQFLHFQTQNRVCKHDINDFQDSFANIAIWKHYFQIILHFIL